jgi:very-short-patch-repair endonuclease
MSDLADRVEQLLKDAFPTYLIRKEKYVLYQNTQLFFDFYMPEFKLLIEVQGQQHYEFNKFFHNDVNVFNKQKYRDSLKTQWASEKHLKLLLLKYDEVELLTKEALKNKIIELL